LFVFLIAYASGYTVDFDKSSGNNYFQGSISVSGGKVAVSLAAVQDATTPKSDIQTTSSDAGGDVSAGQDTSATGEAVFTASVAANSDGDSARTNDLAAGDNAGVTTEQGAHASDDEAGAGQHDTTVSGEVAAASSAATSGCDDTSSSSASAIDGTVEVDHQGAEAGDSAHAGQEAEAQGEVASLTTSASNGDISATTSTTAVNGEVQGDQEAGAEDYGAGANQDTNAYGDVVCAETSVTKEERGPDTTADVTAFASGDGGLADITVEQHAGAGEDGAGAQQSGIAFGDDAAFTASVSDNKGNEASAIIAADDAVIVDATSQSVHIEQECRDTEVEAEQSGGMLDGSWGIMAVSASDKKGDYSNAFAVADEPVLIASDQEAEAGHSASASQDTTIVSLGKADAGTNVGDDDGNTACTDAQLDNGGAINTLQGAAADDLHFYPIFSAEGAAAGQLTEIYAFDGASATSSASNKNADEGAASTGDQIWGEGNITTAQGAGAGNLRLFNLHSEGAAAAQESSLDSHPPTVLDDFLVDDGCEIVGGTAWSNSNNEYDNLAHTEATYYGAGFIDSTIQGATAGESSVYFYIPRDGGLTIEGEGALAAQHTESIMGENGGFAGSSSTNEFENFADTSAGFDGCGYINDTTQGAAAGELEVNHHDVVEGALAIQNTEQIVSLNSPTTSWANSCSSDDDGNFAVTAVQANGPGSEIDGTFQGAAAGEVNFFDIEGDGAIAAGHTDSVDGLDGGWASSSSNNECENFADTNAGFDGIGHIYDTTQGAAAGEVEVHGHDVVEGAIAIQDTEEISSYEIGTVWANSSAMDDDGNCVFTEAYASGPNNAIHDTTQGAAAGEYDFWGVEGDGAIAGQHTECVSIPYQEAGVPEWTGSVISNAYSPYEECSRYGPVYAETGDQFDGTGLITDATQIVAAGETTIRFSDDKIKLEGASAFQDTGEIYASYGNGEAWSTASFADNNEGSAGTNDMFDAGGSIVGTIQGAGAGSVTFYDDCQEKLKLEGAIAAQHTDLITSGSDDSASATSWANNEDRNFANTTVGFAGIGSIEDTTQGAAAGQIAVNGQHDTVEGAIAAQHTGEVETDTSSGSGWASTYAENSADGLYDEGVAVTNATFLGEGSITGTSQVGVAGEIDPFHLEAQGAVAIQHTEEIESDIWGSVNSSANNEFVNFANAVAIYGNASAPSGNNGGELSEATSGAVAGEIELQHYCQDLELEGAAAGQYVNSSVNLVDYTVAAENVPRSDISTTTATVGFAELAAAGEIEDGFHIGGATSFAFPVP
jgi:hypothetical protein